MADRETFAFVYSGVGGVGIGLFSIEGDRLEGRDYAGTTYNGSARRTEDGHIRLIVEMDVPAGVLLTFGPSAQDLPHKRSFDHTFDSNFGDGAPQTVQTGGGALHVMIRRVEDGFHAGVQEGFQIVLGAPPSSAS